MPSSLCYKEIALDKWTEPFCLVKPDVCLGDEADATAIAKEDLASASFMQAKADGDPREFALSLRREGVQERIRFLDCWP